MRRVSAVCIPIILGLIVYTLVWEDSVAASVALAAFGRHALVLPRTIPNSTCDEKQPPEPVATRTTPGFALAWGGVANLTPDELRAESQKLRFYLHEDVFADRLDLAACWLNSIGADCSLIDFDDRADPGLVEHFFDWQLLRRFREHPQRTMDVDAAHLHVCLTFMSLPHRCKGQDPAKARKSSLEALLANLQSLPTFKRREPFLVSYGTISKGSPQLVKVFKDSDHVWIMEDEYWFPGGTKVNSLTVPYVANYQLDAIAWARSTSNLHQPNERSISFTFHGKRQRNGEGQCRGVLIDVIRGNFSDSSLLQYSYESDVKRAGGMESVAKHVRASAQTYLHSKFCLILPGDTHTTRRIFDAMAAGCVPIVYGKVALPFSTSVPWPDLVVFLDTCQVHSVVDKLRELLQQRDLEHGAKAAQDAYARWLSYTAGTGMVSAILKEAGLQMALWKSKIPRHRVYHGMQQGCTLQAM